MLPEKSYHLGHVKHETRLLEKCTCRMPVSPVKYAGNDYSIHACILANKEAAQQLWMLRKNLITCNFNYT